MPNGQPATEIIAAAREARRELADLEQQLQEEIDAIKLNAFRAERLMTADESERRKGLMSDQAEARQAYREMAFLTLRRLDDSEDVKQLLNKMKEINSGLKDDLDELKRIERYAETAAKVAEGIAKVVDKLASLAAGSPFG